MKRLFSTILECTVCFTITKAFAVSQPNIFMQIPQTINGYITSEDGYIAEVRGSYC